MSVLFRAGSDVQSNGPVERGPTGQPIQFACHVQVFSPARSRASRCTAESSTAVQSLYAAAFDCVSKWRFEVVRRSPNSVLQPPRDATLTPTGLAEDLPFLKHLEAWVSSVAVRPQLAGDAVVAETTLFEPTPGRLGSEFDEFIGAQKIMGRPTHRTQRRNHMQFDVPLKTL